MTKGTLKQSFLNGAHTALNAGGNMMAWTPVGIVMLANGLSNAWGNHDSLLDTVARINAPTAAMFTGMIAVGLLAAGAGYGRKLGGEPAAGKSRLSHAFNFAASSVGAAALGLGALGIAAILDNGNPASDMIQPALIALGGAAAFTVGHKRLLGPTLPALPAAPSAPKL